jgi:hypothetical protein
LLPKDRNEWTVLADRRFPWETFSGLLARRRNLVLVSFRKRGEARRYTRTLVRRQPNPDSDLLRRMFVERRPPLTWTGICIDALVSLIGLVLVLVEVGGLWEVLAVLMLATGVFQVLRGILRKVWLRMGGTDQPVWAYLRRRLGRSS